MEDDSEKIRKIGESMMGDMPGSKTIIEKKEPVIEEQESVEAPIEESIPEPEQPKPKKGMFDMPSFGGDAGKSQEPQGFGDMASLGSIPGVPTPKMETVPGIAKESQQGFGNFGGEEPKKKPKKGTGMGFGDEGQADELKALGERMMG